MKSSDMSGIEWACMSLQAVITICLSNCSYFRQCIHSKVDAGVATACWSADLHRWPPSLNCHGKWLNDSRCSTICVVLATSVHMCGPTSFSCAKLCQIHCMVCKDCKNCENCRNHERDKAYRSEIARMIMACFSACRITRCRTERGDCSSGHQCSLTLVSKWKLFKKKYVP